MPIIKHAAMIDVKERGKRYKIGGKKFREEVVSIKRELCGIDWTQEGIHLLS